MSPCREFNVPNLNWFSVIQDSHYFCSMKAKLLDIDYYFGNRSIISRLTSFQKEPI